jgi:hypothetical protein
LARVKRNQGTRFSFAKKKAAPQHNGARTPRKGNNFRAVALFRRVEHGPRLAPATQVLFNIGPTLAAAKTTAAGALNTRSRFRPLRGGGFDSLGVDIVTDTMDHILPIPICERMSIALRMNCIRK